MNYGLQKWALVNGLVAIVVVASVLVMQTNEPLKPEPLAPEPSPSTEPVVVETGVEEQRTRRPDIVTWSEDEIDIILSPGETVTRTVELSSRTDISDVRLAVSPNLVDFVTITPERFQPLRRRTKQQIQLDISASDAVELGTTYHGFLQARRGFTTLREQVGLLLGVWRQFQTEIGDSSVAFSYPPDWSLRQTHISDGGTAIELTSEDGSAVLVLPEGGYSYGLDPNADVTTIATELPSGLTLVLNHIVSPEGRSQVTRASFEPVLPSLPHFRVDIRASVEEERLVRAFLQTFEID